MGSNYNSRNNLADSGGEMPNDMFMKAFTQACKIGYENIKNTKSRKNCCQWHELNGEACWLDATRAIPPLPIQLCDYHAKILCKHLGFGGDNNEKSK